MDVSRGNRNKSVVDGILCVFSRESQSSGNKNDILEDIESHGNHLVDSSFNGINVYCSFRVLIQ